jgi:hypothetical protein
VVINSQRADILDWLLTNVKMDLNIKDDNGNTCLHRLVQSEFPPSVPIIKFISGGARADIRNESGKLAIDLIKDDKMVDYYETLLPFTPFKRRVEMITLAVNADAPKLVTAFLSYFKKAWSNSWGLSQVGLDNALILAAEVASGEVAQGTQNGKDPIM